MKKNKYILIVALLLAIVALIVISKSTKNTIRGASNEFNVKDTSTVTKIFLVDKNNQRVLLKKEKDNHWTVNEKTPAAKKMIDMLLGTINDVVIKEPVPKAAYNNVISRIASIGVKVEIYQLVYRVNFFGYKAFPHEKLTKVYYVGDGTRDNTGTYMLMHGSKAPYITYIEGFRGFLSPRYSTYEADWRSHIVFDYRFPDLKTITVEIPENEKLSFSITRNEQNFTLTSLCENITISDFDTAKAVTLFASFSEINYDKLVDNERKSFVDSIIRSLPYHVITITDINNQQKTLKTFHKMANPADTDLEGNPLVYDKDYLYALLPTNELVLIQFYAFDNILRPLPYYLKQSFNKAVKKQ